MAISQITSNSIAAGAVSASDLADGSISADKLANSAVTVGKLSTTGSASSSTYLRGDMAWAALPASGKLLKATIMYNSTTRTTGTNSTYWGTIGGVNVYYNNAAMMSGSFTKQSSTSIVVFYIQWNLKAALNGHGVHGALFWKDTGVYYPLNENFHNTSGTDNISRGFIVTVGGLSTGSHTFYMSGTRADSTAAQWALNPNQEGATLCLNQGQSTMIAYEIEV